MRRKHLKPFEGRSGLEYHHHVVFITHLTKLLNRHLLQVLLYPVHIDAQLVKQVIQKVRSIIPLPDSSNRQVSNKHKQKHSNCNFLLLIKLDDLESLRLICNQHKRIFKVLDQQLRQLEHLLLRRHFQKPVVHLAVQDKPQFFQTAVVTLG